MPEQYHKRVFSMDGRHLRATLAVLSPKKEFKSKSEMREEIVDWLISEGHSLKHEFLFFKDDSGDVWLLTKNYERSCKCFASVISIPSNDEQKLSDKDKNKQNLSNELNRVEKKDKPAHSSDNPLKPHSPPYVDECKMKDLEANLDNKNNNGPQQTDSSLPPPEKPPRSSFALTSNRKIYDSSGNNNVKAVTRQPMPNTLGFDKKFPARPNENKSNSFPFLCSDF